MKAKNPSPKGLEVIAIDYIDFQLVVKVKNAPRITIKKVVLLDQTLNLEVPTEYSLVEDVINIKIALDALLPIADFSNVKLVCFDDKGTEYLVDVFNETKVGQELEIKDEKAFWKRINSPAREIKNPYLLRHCCKRSVALFSDDFNVIGASLCALGYRILDANNKGDPDITWFEDWSSRIISWRLPVDSGDEARWVTSVCILRAYININFGDNVLAAHYLHKCIQYRSMVKYRPMIQINIARAFFLLGHFSLKKNDLDLAREYFSNIDGVAIDGILFSDLSNPNAGKHKFSEFVACIKALKEARRGILAIDQHTMNGKELANSYSLLTLAGYINTLSKREVL